ncbi:hypothetical protein AMS68_000098 [Peltaster fructicola]|uniref:Svf1-like C-terminal domain-containing protein n=1 Tax=Peltaster fructicola TaxID=286661 RepID=A0A6H0XIW9_9PEZI|nr:hypothetical protein AMS68_000098 [Peltaster fructicola]
MFGWTKNASVVEHRIGDNTNIVRSVGLTDKHHGAAALRSVKEQTLETPYTELTTQDQRWELMNSTCLEMQTFYVTTDDGTIAIIDVVYSNVLNLKTTVQFNVKIFYGDESKPHLWNTDVLSDFEFVNEQCDLVSGKCSIKLVGQTYTIKSTVNEACTVDLSFSQLAPGFKVGRDGTSTFGAKKANGKVKHTFWPRVKVEGTMTTREGCMDMKGIGTFVHSLQGIKPHFAAAKWNFANFQSPTYSAVSMEYTTPPSYDNSVVSVGGLAINGKVVIANANSSTTHTSVALDPESNLQEPKSITHTWSGTSSDGKEISAEIKAVFPARRRDRIDVFDEVPKFLKGIVAAATGIRPYIYQNAVDATLVVNEGGAVKSVPGRLMCEVVFMS